MVLISEYTPQSGNVATSESEQPSRVEQTITAFAEQKPGWMTEIKSEIDETMNIVNSTPSSISSFLNRPVKIANYSWGVSQPLFHKFNPWQLWVEDPRVKEKMSHYNLLRCKLHVKIVISGTGFHYGRALMGYNPWSAVDDLTVTRDFLEVDMVQLSQKPKVFINPTTNSGGEMLLPFFYNKNYVSLPQLEYRDLGEMYLKSFDILRHANGGDDPVNMTVFAWAEDVTLAMPTSAYTVQSGKRMQMNSGDEYGKGIISSTASAIADAAGALADAPVIGPYARATEMCARTGADVASHFGYSRPPVISDIQLYKPNPTGNLANTDAADAVNRLTLDSKQELTVDSRTVGLDGTDHMDIKSIVTRESYLTQFNWFPTQGPNARLFQSRVGPGLYRVHEPATAGEIHPTPMSMIQNMFDKWQGTMKFRFQVVKSAFHKGRLLIRWDPQAHNMLPEYNTTYSRVVDIAEEDDFEIEIGWGVSSPFLLTHALYAGGGNTFGGSGPRFTADTFGLWNGVLEVDVLNQLVSPAADAQISINVFVSMCDDAKFGAPTQVAMNRLSVHPYQPDVPPAATYTPQSGELESLAGPTSAMTDKPEDVMGIQAIAPMSTTSDKQYQVFFGEAPKSLRELFRRYSMTKAYSEIATRNSTKLWDLTLPALPFNYGFDPNGMDTNGGNPCVLCNVCPLSYMLPCFAGWRGSIRHKFMFDGEAINRFPVVQRVGFLPYSNSSTVINIDPKSYREALSRRYAEDGYSGQANTDRQINGVIEVEVPYYNGLRMSPTRSPNLAFSNGSEAVKLSSLLYIHSSQTTDQVRIATVFDYVAAGEDFSLFFFIGCPIMYEYDLSGFDP